MLLVLVAHAFVASATHFHASFVPSAGSAQAALQSRDEGGHSAPSSGEARCLLCRLQRDFASVVQHSTLVLAPPPAAAVKHESLRNTPAPAVRSLLRSGRAPPLA